MAELPETVKAISSLKPFSKCHPDIAENQIRAKSSWDRMFDGVIYFNDPQPEVSGDTTEFVPSEDPPRIKAMAEWCAKVDGWSCIINSDIIVGDYFPAVLQQLKEKNALCAMSQRHEIPVGGTAEDARLVDLGLDFFAATPWVWAAVAENVPSTFVMGKILWDFWLNNFLSETFGHGYYDITQSTVIFHPHHGHRDNQNIHMQPDRFMQRNRWPRLTIGFASNPQRT